MKTNSPIISNTDKLSTPSKKIRNLVLLGLTAIIVIFSSYFFSQPSYKHLNLQKNKQTWFTHQPLLQNIYALFDFGVTDIDLDHQIDVFTISHSGQQYFLHNSNKVLSTENTISQFGLDQDSNFPGLEVEKGPKIKDSGLYFYWKNRNFIIESKNLKNIELIKGKIDFFVPAKVKQNKSFEVNLTDREIPTGAKVSSVEFSTQAKNGKLVISTYNTSLPVTLKIDEQIPLEEIYIGNQAINPNSYEFSLYLRDRHGMAWANIDGKNFLDVFIGRGALRNRADLYPEKYIAGELLVNQDNSTYTNLAESLKIAQGCNATQAAWVDFDSDDILDLYTACETDSDNLYPNLLFRQGEDGIFSNVAAEANLDLAGKHSSFVWFDVDNDGDSDLFWADKKSFSLYVNNSGKFVAQIIKDQLPLKSVADAPKYKWFKYNLTTADYDADGDIDVFAASSTGNLVFINTNGKFDVVQAESLGLSKWDLTANWVDYDNDGITDLHLFPHGIYRQNKDGKFIATHLLEGESKNLITAIATWVDINNDGFRDLLIATQHPSSPFTKLYSKAIKKIWKEPVSPDDWNWQLELYPNVTNANHWLEVDLIGTPQNRSAIGAKVELINSNGKQLQVVGQAEGSRASQGHYRLYFGLGENPQIEKIKVTWSNGTVQEIVNPQSDRLLTIEANV